MTTKEKNDKIFKEHIILIEKLCLENWLAAEIAKKIGMDRHSMLDRLRKTDFYVNQNLRKNTTTKRCSCCKFMKPVGQFIKHNKSGGGKFSGRCIDCRKQYKVDNPEMFLLYQAKANAKKRELEFNLTKEDIVIPEYCPILKVKLSKKKGNIKYSPSIDRINNSKGYIKGNVMIISTRANLMKNDASLEELKAFAQYYTNLDKLI